MAYIVNISSGSNGITQQEAEAMLASKQDKLYSGQNIKTVNNTSLLGSGNIPVTQSAE